MDYTLKHYTIKSGLLSSYFIFKYVHKVSFHDSSMNIFDKNGMSYNFGKRTDSEKRKPVSDSVTQNLLKKVNPVEK